MKHFAHVQLLAHIARARNGAVLDEYAVYRLDGFDGQFLQPTRVSLEKTTARRSGR